MKLQIANKASRLMNKAGLAIKKHSPEILMVAGIAGTVASTVMACKATTKVNDILEEPKKTIDIVHQGMKDGQINGTEYTQEDGKKDLTIIYTQTGVKLLKLYGPSLVLGGLSIASIVAGHKILKKRNLALAAAYAVVDKGFKEYRKNVVDRFGEEVDKELRHGIKAKMVETETVDENGNTVIKQEIVHDASSKHSDYTRIFDSSCHGHSKDSEANLMYLRRIQDYANERLRARGYLFLNDVYDMLDIPRSKAGQSVGWIYDVSRPAVEGDNYIDFGIYRPENARFVNGLEYNIWLDFNVDGPIIEQFWKMNGGK